MQTKSLHLLDSTGKEWSLRTVEKYVSGALPKALQNTLVQKVTQDFISSSYPYGAAIAGELTYAAGVNAARPEVFFVEDDAMFGIYRHPFTNTICTLEERDPGFDSTENSLAVLQNIINDNRYKIQQPVLLKARIMDMIVSDWDRHSDNWRWGIKDSAGLLHYYAIPRDRDWVFYKSGGLVPKLIKFLALRHLISFTDEPRHIKNLSWKASLFDKKFLNELTAADWEQTIKEVQTAVTDSAIEAAVKKMPASVYALDGVTFITRIKSRRDALKGEVMKYYNFLSEEIIINGSNKNELFSVVSDGVDLKILVYQTGEKGSKQKKIYERNFSSSETYLITINGLGGDDVFETDEKAKSKIRIKIYGGGGNDSYDLKGDIKTHVYDAASEKNSIVNRYKAKIQFK